MKKLLIITAGSLLLTAGNNAIAAQATSQTVYSINITTACTISSTAAVSFGASSPLAAARTNVAAGTVSIVCNNLIPYAFGVNSGQNYSGGFHNMAFGASLVGYQLKYSGTLLGDVGLTAIDSSYVQTTTENAVTGLTGTGSPQTYNILADIAAIPGTAIAGVHSDTVTYTVTF